MSKARPEVQPDLPRGPWRAVDVRGYPGTVNIVSDEPDGDCNHTLIASMVPKDGKVARWLLRCGEMFAHGRPDAQPKIRTCGLNTIPSIADAVAAAAEQRRSEAQLRRPTLDEVEEYVVRRNRAAIADGNVEANAAYLLVLDFVRNARFDVPADPRSAAAQGGPRTPSGEPK